MGSTLEQPPPQLSSVINTAQSSDALTSLGQIHDDTYDIDFSASSGSSMTDGSDSSDESDSDRSNSSHNSSASGSSGSTTESNDTGDPGSSARADILVDRIPSRAASTSSTGNLLTGSVGSWAGKSARSLTIPEFPDMSDSVTGLINKLGDDTHEIQRQAEFVADVTEWGPSHRSVFEQGFGLTRSPLQQGDYFVPSLSSEETFSRLSNVDLEPVNVVTPAQLIRSASHTSLTTRQIEPSNSFDLGVASDSSLSEKQLTAIWEIASVQTIEDLKEALASYAGPQLDMTGWGPVARMYYAQSQGCAVQFMGKLQERCAAYELSLCQEKLKPAITPGKRSPKSVALDNFAALTFPPGASPSAADIKKRRETIKSQRQRNKYVTDLATRFGGGILLAIPLGSSRT